MFCLVSFYATKQATVNSLVFVLRFGCNCQNPSSYLSAEFGFGFFHEKEKIGKVWGNIEEKGFKRL